LLFIIIKELKITMEDERDQKDERADKKKLQIEHY
jgi:hypothetical protein